MNFTNSETVDIDGTDLQGSVVATRREIEAVFGAPAFEGDTGKTTTEWWIAFDDGVVATIYDWKRYELGAPTMDERITWNVGGRSFAAVERVEDTLLVSA